jgi:hypothetical protein
VEVNGVSSPMFHTNTTDPNRIHLPREAVHSLTYLVDTPFVDTATPEEFMVRIRSSNAVWGVGFITLLDRNGEALGTAVYSSQDGSGEWTPFESIYVCGECAYCIENDSPGLLDLGEMYFQDLESMDCIDNDGNGIYFARNQVLLTAQDSVVFSEIKMLASQYNAEIVGFIELTNSFQLEVSHDVTIDCLRQIITELMSNSIIKFASLNTIIASEYSSAPDVPPHFEESVSLNGFDALNSSGLESVETMAAELSRRFEPNDPWPTRDGLSELYWNRGAKCCMSTLVCINWGLKAIYAPEMWQFRDMMSGVNVGVFDDAFYGEHPDMDFYQILHNPTTLIRGDANHGTSVASIISAGFDNGDGNDNDRNIVENAEISAEYLDNLIGR